MFYSGLDWELAPEYLDDCPTQLFFDGNSWVLYKKLTLALDGREYNRVFRIHEFPSIGAVLFAFLFDEYGFCTASQKIKSRILMDIEQIYIRKDSLRPRLSYKQKFRLIQQFTRRETRGGRAITPPIRDVLAREAEAHGEVKAETYDEAVRLVKRIGFELPENDIYEFEDSDQLVAWVLAYLVDNDIVIGRCRTCRKYYIKPNERSVYCGKACYNNRDKSGSFLGEEDIESRYKRIAELFRRKKRSKSTYKYCADEQVFADGYDEERLFREIAGGSKTCEEIVFSADDFETLSQTHAKEYKSRYNLLKEMKKSVENGSVSEEEYQGRLKEFKEWYSNREEQLRCFSIDTDARCKKGAP